MNVCVRALSAQLVRLPSRKRTLDCKHPSVVATRSTIVSDRHFLVLCWSFLVKHCDASFVVSNSTHRSSRFPKPRKASVSMAPMLLSCSHLPPSRAQIKSVEPGTVRESTTYEKFIHLRGGTPSRVLWIVRVPDHDSVK